jgi:hypothetical protein
VQPCWRVSALGAFNGEAEPSGSLNWIRFETPELVQMKYRIVLHRPID